MLRPHIIIRILWKSSRKLFAPIGITIIAIFIVATAAGLDIIESSANYVTLKRYERELARTALDPRIPQVVVPVPKARKLPRPSRYRSFMI